MEIERKFLVIDPPLENAVNKSEIRQGLLLLRQIQPRPFEDRDQTDLIQLLDSVLSTVESNGVFSQFYPILFNLPNGLEKK